jgi:hypothetical protein
MFNWFDWLNSFNWFGFIQQIKPIEQAGVALNQNLWTLNR